MKPSPADSPGIRTRTFAPGRSPDWRQGQNTGHGNSGARRGNPHEGCFKRRKKALQAEVREHVEAGSAIFTDALKSDEGLSEFEHQVVDNAAENVRGNVHTNGMENFWSLVKRGLKGTHISVEPFHLFRYLDEQAYRYK
jgi:hypothetical protein